ncbi:MAG: hypothetical protein Q9196_007046, partial [Gyalolechia fulgens]
KLPFLAGSVVPFSKDQPWLREIHQDGAAYLEIQDLSRDLSYEELSKASFPPSLLDSEQLCPFPESIYIRDGPIDVCRLRANFVDGGLLLVISVVHTVCDGHGISDVISLFADEFREAQQSPFVDVSAAPDPPHEIYAFDRARFLSGHDRLGNLENHPAWTTSPLVFPSNSVKTNDVCICFHVSSDSLSSLKDMALPQMALSASPTSPAGQSSARVPKISTHDAIAALVWRSIMLARHRAGKLSEVGTTNFTQAVDCRTRLNLPRPYHGNAFYGYKTSMTLPQILQSSSTTDQCRGVQEAAQAIHLGRDGVTADGFRDLLSFVEKTQMEKALRYSVLEDLAQGSVFLISYFWFGMHNLDFGEALGGKIKAFRLPSRGLIPGVPIILPRLPDGSCEMIFNEPEEVMRYLAEDSVFQRFVTRKD